jgi:type VI secretion system secreted protein Hcp
MAGDVFLKLDGVNGDSKRKGHEKEIELQSWSWGMSQSGSVHTATGAGQSKVSVQDLSFTASMSFAGATLAQFCANGKHIATGKLTARKADGTSDGVDYLTIEMKDIIITSYGTGGSGEFPTEHFTIQFAEFTQKFTEQTEKGGKGSSKQYTVNVPQNSHS